MKNVAITGINGFIGGVVAQHFLDQKHEVKGCGSQPSPLNEKQPISFISGRFQESEVAQKLVSNTDVLVHCAGKIHLYYGVNPDIFQVNCLDTLQLARKAIDADVKHFIYLSSIHAFEEGLPEVNTESKFEEDPIVAYNYSKAMAVKELRSLFAHSETKLTVVYPTAVMGHHNYTGTSMMKILNMADQMPVLFLPNAHFDVVDVDDVAEAIVNVSERSIEGDYILGGHKTSMKAITKTYLSQSSKNKPIITLPIPFLIPIAQIFEVLRIQSNFSLYNMNTLKYGTQMKVNHDTEEIIENSPTNISKIISKIIAWKSRKNS